jgi:hypothetical protein
MVFTPYTITARKTSAVLTWIDKTLTHEKPSNCLFGLPNLDLHSWIRVSSLHPQVLQIFFNSWRHTNPSWNKYLYLKTSSHTSQTIVQDIHDPLADHITSQHQATSMKKLMSNSNSRSIVKLIKAIPFRPIVCIHPPPPCDA